MQNMKTALGMQVTATNLSAARSFESGTRTSVCHGQAARRPQHQHGAHLWPPTHVHLRPCASIRAVPDQDAQQSMLLEIIRTAKQRGLIQNTQPPDKLRSKSAYVPEQQLAAVNRGLHRQGSMQSELVILKNTSLDDAHSHGLPSIGHLLMQEYVWVVPSIDGRLQAEKLTQEQNNNLTVAFLIDSLGPKLSSMVNEKICCTNSKARKEGLKWEKKDFDDLRYAASHTIDDVLNNGLWVYHAMLHKDGTRLSSGKQSLPKSPGLYALELMITERAGCPQPLSVPVYKGRTINVRSRMADHLRNLHTTVVRPDPQAKYFHIRQHLAEGWGLAVRYALVPEVFHLELQSRDMDPRKIKLVLKELMTAWENFDLARRDTAYNTIGNTALRQLALPVQKLLLLTDQHTPMLSDSASVARAANSRPHGVAKT